MYKAQAYSHFDVLQILHRCYISWSLCVTSRCASETHKHMQVKYIAVATQHIRETKGFVYVVL